MRIKLRSLKKRRSSFTAVFSRFGVKKIAGKEEISTENTKIQFKAAVYEYVKGYLGKKPVLGKRLLKVDYTLIYISDIKIIE